MLVHPQIDPVAISMGPISVHWYGLMYLVAFLAFIVLGKYRIKANPNSSFTQEILDDMLFFGMLGVIVGGRLGHVLFYQPGYYLEHPLSAFAIWEGGMSFHGGLLGVLVAMVFVARKYQLPWLKVTDFIAPLIPPGLGAGRIGNFINAELWGRTTDVSWGMVFPHVDEFPRHPSQLYQFALEGIVLFTVLWIYSAKPRPTGAVSGIFLIGYGTLRSFAEFFREPEDGFMGISTLGITMGQWLSIPMILVGMVLLFWSKNKTVSSEKTVLKAKKTKK